MHNWSLVCFTLVTQGAIGLVWGSVAADWFVDGMQPDLTPLYMVVALSFTGIGLLTALAHLARPRLAPNALRNLSTSWLSREVVLVQIFTVTLALVILSLMSDTRSILILMEAVACLMGGGLLFAMTKVYLLKTVPEWNTLATPLEFTGTALLLGGSLGAMLTSFVINDSPTLSQALMVFGLCVLIGLMLKTIALAPALDADKEAREQTWYEPAAASLTAGRMLTIRMALNLFSLLMILAAISETCLNWVLSSICLICIAVAEILGRVRFYRVYRRIGL